MSSLLEFLVSVCNPAAEWIETHIKHGRKIGFVGKDIQLLMDICHNPTKEASGQNMDIWLVVMDDTKVNANNERIVQLMWPDIVSNLTLIEDDLWTWAWYKSPILPNLKVWLYRYHSDSSLPYRNSLERGIVHSIDETDNALTTMDWVDESATTLYVALNKDSPVPWKVTMPSLSDHPSPESLTLQCHTTVTSSVRLPLHLR